MPATAKAKTPTPLGRVTHFYDKINVAAVLLSQKLQVGDNVKIGKNENFVEEQVSSMQLEHKPVTAAKKGQEIGLKVSKPVREGDLVFKA